MRRLKWWANSGPGRHALAYSVEAEMSLPRRRAGLRMAVPV